MTRVAAYMLCAGFERSLINEKTEDDRIRYAF